MKKFYERLWYAAALPLGWLVLVALVVYFDNEAISLRAPLESLKWYGFTDMPDWLKYSLVGSLVFTAIFAMANPFYKSKTDYGGAHWAKEKEVRNKLNLRGKSGMILGKFKNRFLRMDKPLSVLCFAPPGSGKTAGVVIPSVIASGNSCIVHDLKGEVFDHTASHRAKFSKIYRFAPGEIESDKWNPLGKSELPQREDYTSEKDWWNAVTVVVDRYANIIIDAIKPDKTIEYWSKEAQAIFNFWALFLIHTNRETTFSEILTSAIEGHKTSNKEGVNEEELLSVLSEIDKEEQKEEQSQSSQEAIEIALLEENLPDRVRLEGKSLVSKPHKEFSGAFSTFRTKLSIFFDGRVANNTSESSFSFRDMRKERTTVYLVISPNDITRLGSLISIFFESAALAFQAKTPEKNELGITLFIDEFVRLPKMTEVLNMPALGRGYKFNALYICQSLSQLVSIYGQSGADALKATCSYHLVFSQNEPKVAEEYSKAIGNYTRRKRTYTNQGGIKRSEGEADEGVPLMRAQEILSLPEGKLVVMMQNNFERPILADAAFWFKDRNLRKVINA